MTPSAIAFLLVTGFTAPGGQATFLSVPGLSDENECHRLALKLGVQKHGCFEYRVPAVSEDNAIENDAAEASAVPPPPQPYRLGAECHAGWSGSECWTYRTTGTQPDRIE